MSTRRVVEVRCRAADCAAVFAVRVERLGRNLHCPVCRARLTARPVEVERALSARESRSEQATGLVVARLPLTAIVDNVRSLWNVGSIFRTADACGVRSIGLTGITGCPPRAEISKTALGAENAVSWRYDPDPLNAVRRIVEEGFTPVAIEFSRRSVSIEQADWPERICLVVGNEVAGVSPPALDACAQHVHIPMRGVKQSLNVAVAFGIAACEAARVTVARAVSTRTVAG
jgi:23S rRNA (guanosine2251-2'-O)-methyltransferase